jgi:hypothetical protein
LATHATTETAREGTCLKTQSQTLSGLKNRAAGTQGAQVATRTDKYSAGEQGLGYIYQIRYALAHLMQQDESHSLLIEADDDVEVKDVGGQRTLISLKHKQAGETVGTLSVDFWKSVRIWLDRYVRDGKVACDHSYCMVTTARVGSGSMLRYFQSGANFVPPDFAEQMITELEGSATKLSGQIKNSLSSLTNDECRDFFARIAIADCSLRVEELDAALAPHLRSVPLRFRVDVRERLEGWWFGQSIDVIRRGRVPLTGAEVWTKFASISAQYQDDDLPITFGDACPPYGVDARDDTRQFVQQLRAIGMPADSLEMAILDYYRAFSQRSHWARVNVLVTDEMEKFEHRLADEWRRAKAYVKVAESDNEAKLQDAGQQLYRWAETQTTHIQIRKRVTDEFVRRGSFHLLADEKPKPRIHWHPKFLEHLEATLLVTA